MALSVNALVPVAVLLTGTWLGEAGSNPIHGLRGLALGTVLAVGLVVWFTKGHRRSLRAAASFGCIAAACVGFMVGQHSAMRAYNACVEHREEIRDELRAYRQREGHFPVHLAEALGRNRSCTRPLRGSLLRYSATDSSYELEFGDYLTTWRSTNRDAFIATK